MMKVHSLRILTYPMLFQGEMDKSAIYVNIYENYYFFRSEAGLEASFVSD